MIRAAKGFCNWMVRQGRASENPLRFLEMLNDRIDRRRQRRVFSIEELRILISTAQQGPQQYRMSGPERSLLYRVAVETGLRSKEIRSLRTTSLREENGISFIVVNAAYSKNRHETRMELKPAQQSSFESFS